MKLRFDLLFDLLKWCSFVRHSLSFHFVTFLLFAFCWRKVHASVRSILWKKVSRCNIISLVRVYYGYVGPFSPSSGLFIQHQMPDSLETDLCFLALFWVWSWWSSVWRKELSCLRLGFTCRFGVQEGSHYGRKMDGGRWVMFNRPLISNPWCWSREITSTSSENPFCI